MYSVIPAWVVNAVVVSIVTTFHVCAPLVRPYATV